MSLVESYPELITALTEFYGLPDQGPAVNDLFEAVLTVSLGRSLAPVQAGAIRLGLRDAGLSDPDSLASADASALAEIARCSGVPRATKTLRPLQRLARWVVDRGGAETLADAPTEALRDELLGINGIGPASADAILLHALGRPIYPVDRATYRILVRHAWLDPSSEYDEARDVVQRCDPDYSAALARLSAWFERVGVSYCRPSVAKCLKCPLRPFLPEDGPRETDS
ncbi:MAG: endonuclease III [Isosphaeraceae bacterium]